MWDTRKRHHVPSPRHPARPRTKKKGKFYFLFLWSLIADQSLSSRCPGRQPGPAFGPGLPAPSSSPLCFSCFHPPSPPDPPHRLLWESRGCSPATGNGGEFSGFTRPPQAPGGGDVREAPASSHIHLRAAPGEPRLLSTIISICTRLQTLGRNPKGDMTCLLCSRRRQPELQPCQGWKPVTAGLQ